MPYGTVNADLMTTSDGVSSSGLYGFKNRIINGAMVIDQRNAGASVTVNSGTDFFPVDRFLAVGTASSGVFTVQRSSTAPTGFINSLLATVTTTDASLAAADQYYVSQIIEGLNVADLAWGTASAATVTLSFWVYSSLTGTFGGAIRNSAANRSYPFTYTISSANTWEQKSVTIAGDTSGTWLTTSGKGLDITWTLGLGSTFSGTAGVWAGANYKGASGVTNVMATNGATFYITGVQLEKGSTATSFDYRPYGTELSLCQRYYYRITAGVDAAIMSDSGYAVSTTSARFVIRYPITMRTAPTALEQTGTAANYVIRYQSSSVASSAVPTFLGSGIATTENYAGITATVASGLTAGDSVVLTSSGTTPYLGWSAEL
jgi:hypothetical protein